MTMILAADLPDGDGVKDFLMVAMFLLVMAAAVKNLLAKSPTHAELATKKELEGFVKQSQFNEFKAEVRGDVNAILARIDGAMSKMELLHKEGVKKVEGYAEKSYQSRQRIHKQVNGIDKELASVKTRQNEQEKQINKLQAHA